MRWRRALASLCVALALACVWGAGSIAGATSAPRATGSIPGSAVTMTSTVTREFLTSGVETVVDQRSVTLSVSQTRDLRGRQEIHVSWSGAHPTGGIVADQNSILADQEEYPMVLLECRGTTATASSPVDDLSPETCWTQNWSERYQDTFQTKWPPYEMDQFATPADRARVADAPNPLPDSCAYLPAPTQHWVPFVAADGQVYDGGPQGCAGQPPESENVGNSALPSNETFGVTGVDGRGSASFDVWTEAENASLGCSQSVPCSLVAVPIEGVSCDTTAQGLPSADVPTGTAGAAAISDCEATGAFTPGQIVNPEGNEDLSVSGALWWTASNWRNRIVVPLSFAPPQNACSVVGGDNTVDIYGSELMIQATSQWAPHFCLNSKLFNIVHVQTGEPEARNLLASLQSEAALTSYAQSGGYGRPVVNAPVAVTGFSISYDIDGANGQPYPNLRLTPRLLAKLLTESYPAELPVQEEDPALAHNPLNITLDPEFIQLNPGITQGVSATEAASELVALSSDSDVMEALTTYINDNPEARAWLNGAADPWGMVVNPAYKGIQLPVNQWPLLSTFEPTKYYESDNNDCLYNSPVPYLPLVAAPVATLEDASEDMQFSIDNSTTVCSQIDGTSVGEKLVAQGRETVGHRFLIGVTPLADDSRYGLSPAALLTNDNTYVTPSTSSLAAAADLLTPSSATNTWTLPMSTIETSPSAKNAYPGTMVVYAAVPTSGLPHQDAQDFASFIDFAVGPGQELGYNVGQLPPGYLPLTADSHLASLAAYSDLAALDVAAQNGEVPPVDGATPPPTTVPVVTTPSSVVTTTTTPPAVHLVALGVTPTVTTSSFGGVLRVLLLVAALAFLLSAGALLLSGRRR